MKIGRGEFLLGDCFEHMANIPDGSVDMILCDLPYGTTACKWDSIIPFEPLWREYWRVAKPTAAVVLTASQPFTSALVMSQAKRFKHEWIWQKTRGSNPGAVKFAPFKKHESVLIFSTGNAYRPIMETGKLAVKSGHGSRKNEEGISGGGYAGIANQPKKINNQYYPGSVLSFPSPAQGATFHPTQKPVALFEYLIRTYTDEGMTVLDNCAGSGTTAVAAENTSRNWICIERDHDYYAKATERVIKHVGGLRAV